MEGGLGPEVLGFLFIFWWRGMEREGRGAEDMPGGGGRE